MIQVIHLLIGGGGKSKLLELHYEFGGRGAISGDVALSAILQDGGRQASASSELVCF